jgi:pilus assembly protein CpaB
MNRRILLIVSCALVLSVCASYLVYRAVGAKVSAAKAAPTAELVVAARDLAVGTVIHDVDAKMAAWLGPVPVGAILTRDGFLNRGVVSSIYDGEPLTENRLAPKGSGGGLAATIPPGMRACAVRVNEVVGDAGFVVAGMRVDVLISGVPPGGATVDGPKVRTLLQNIQVLSAGTNFQKDQEGKPEQAQVVNLLVTPGQAEILSLASNETHIQLVLRNPMDTQISGLPGTILSDLFGGARAPEPIRSEHPAGVRPKSASPDIHPIPPDIHPAPTVIADPSPSLYTIDVLNGSVRSQAKFSRPVGKQ